jgi:lipoyl(octanoyl) transferase
MSDLGAIKVIETASPIEYNRAIRILNKLKNHNKQIVWILEHENVYTAGKSTEFDCNVNSIPIIKSNRGGQLTFHGIGQIVIYFVYNLKSNAAFINNIFTISDFVDRLEDFVIAILKDYGVKGCKINQQRGVYVEDKKIASIGLNVSKNIITHGISINVNNDLSFFKSIIACGSESLEFTSLEKIKANKVDIYLFKKICRKYINNYFLNLI